MHIIFGVEGNVEIEHGRHVFDVQPAGGHVSANQQIDFAFFEGVQRFEAFVLALVAMQRRGLEAFALQRTRKARTAEFAVDKHEGLFQLALAQDLVQGVAFVVVTDAVKMLLHRAGRGIGAGYFDGDRVLQVTAGQAFDFWRKRR